MTTTPEAARLAEEAKRFGRRKWYDLMDKAIDALAALSQPDEARDAARYRFLRFADLDAMCAEYWPGGQVPEGSEFDAAIDAAMSKEQP